MVRLAEKECAMAQIPTTMALAFINAVVKENKKNKLDVSQGKGNWIARHIVIKCDDPKFQANQSPMRRK
jgi:hypothetical protein